MECHYCHTHTRKFLCSRCLKDKLDSHNVELSPLEAERDKLVEEASQFVKSSLHVRELWSEKHNCTVSIERATEEQRRINQECESARRRMEQLRVEIEKRRSRLESVDRGHIEAAMADCTKDIQQVKKRWHRVHKMTVSARRVLVQEIVSLFEFKPGVVEDSPALALDPRPVSSTSSSSSSSSPSLPFAQKDRPSPQQPSSHQQQPEDLYICGVALSARIIDVSKSTEELNAAIGHLIHMLGLIVRYLGIKLPFPVFYRTMYPYVRSAGSKERHTSSSKMPLFLDDKNLRRFTIGMAMLNYDIAYLCHSQGVEIPISQAANPLQALMACCRSPRLGMRSHVSAYQGIRSTDFQLEFQQVVRVTTNRYRSGSPITTELNKELVLNGLLQSNPADEWYYYDGFLDNSEDDIQDDEEDDDGGVNSDNWNLVDVMPSFGRPNGDGERIFPLGATIMPGVIGISRNVIGNMIASGSSQDNHHSGGEQQESQAEPANQLLQQYPYYYRRLSAAVKRNGLSFRPLI